MSKSHGHADKRIQFVSGSCEAEIDAAIAQVREGKLPEPDVRGGGGKSHKWMWKNLRPSLETVSDRQLPEQVPGSRII